jgi:hypothetical protein
MDIALKHIQGGKSVNDEAVTEEYFNAALDNRRIDARIADNPPGFSFGGDGPGEDDEKLKAAFKAGVQGKEWRSR